MPRDSENLMAGPGLPRRTKEMLANFGKFIEAYDFRITLHLGENFVDARHEINSIIIDTNVKSRFYSTKSDLGHVTAYWMSK